MLITLSKTQALASIWLITLPGVVYGLLWWCYLQLFPTDGVNNPFAYQFRYIGEGQLLTSMLCALAGFLAALFVQARTRKLGFARLTRWFTTLTASLATTVIANVILNSRHLLMYLQNFPADISSLLFACPSLLGGIIALLISSKR